MRTHSTESQGFGESSFSSGCFVFPSKLNSFLGFIQLTQSTQLTCLERSFWTRPWVQHKWRTFPEKRRKRPGRSKAKLFLSQSNAFDIYTLNTGRHNVFTFCHFPVSPCTDSYSRGGRHNWNGTIGDVAVGVIRRRRHSCKSSISSTMSAAHVVVLFRTDKGCTNAKRKFHYWIIS